MSYQSQRQQQGAAAKSANWWPSSCPSWAWPWRGRCSTSSAACPASCTTSCSSCFTLTQVSLAMTHCPVNPSSAAKLCKTLNPRTKHTPSHTDPGCSCACLVVQVGGDANVRAGAGQWQSTCVPLSTEERASWYQLAGFSFPILTESDTAQNLFQQVWHITFLLPQLWLRYALVV